MMSMTHLAALVIAATACATDVRSRRIPNRLTFGAALAGAGYQLAANGFGGLGDSLLGWIVGAAFLFLPFALGGIGAGDVKLMAALGAWLGPAEVMWLGMYTGVAGGAIALVVALSKGYASQMFANVRLLITHWRVAGVRALPELTLQHGRGPRLAYGVAILAGTMVTVWVR
jgi:prepilin peptidase CpaA